MLEIETMVKTDNWNRGESIADHMYRMSLMTLLCPPSLAPKVDLNKCMKMCLIHDMAESIVGDITPVDGVPKPEKSRHEAETMDYISKNLLGKVYGGLAGQEIRAIWQERTSQLRRPSYSLRWPAHASQLSVPVSGSMERAGIRTV